MRGFLYSFSRTDNAEVRKGRKVCFYGGERAFLPFRFFSAFHVWKRRISKEFFFLGNVGFEYRHGFDIYG